MELTQTGNSLVEIDAARGNFINSMKNLFIILNKKNKKMKCR